MNRNSSDPRDAALKGFIVALMFVLTVIAIFLLSGCGSVPQQTAVTEYRASLPFISTPLPTGSMQPTLTNGQQTLNYWQPYAEVHLGCLVGRMDPWGGKVWIHRVVRNDGTPETPRWVTQGDHNAQPDPGHLFEENYVGMWKPIPTTVAK